MTVTCGGDTNIKAPITANYTVLAGVVILNLHLDLIMGKVLGQNILCMYIKFTFN